MQPVDLTELPHFSSSPEITPVCPMRQIELVAWRERDTPRTLYKAVA